VPFAAVLRLLRGLFQKPRPVAAADPIPLIDQELLRRAQALSGLATANEVINQALAVMVGEKADSP
jgi:hypothetical protein